MRHLTDSNHPDTNQPFTYPAFQVGDKVIDRTAEEEGWQDVSGEVIQVDGSNVKVRYTSGNTRWKMPVNLRYNR